MGGRTTLRTTTLWLVLASSSVSFAQTVGDQGRQVYNERCSYCHGEAGKGDGPPNPNLDTKSRDFTSGTYKFRSTESGSIPTDDDIRRSITEGLPGTSMPAWKGLLSDDEIRAVIGTVKSFSTRFETEKPNVVPIPTRVLYPESGARKGEGIYVTLQCASCHGSDGTGKDAIATEFADEWGYELSATNLTEPWTFKGGSSEKDIYLRLRSGIDGTPMPSYKGGASDADLYSLAQYVRSLARKPAWKMTADKLQALYRSESERSSADPAARGRYLVSALGCTDCHTPVQQDGRLMSEFVLAGGQRWSIEPFFSSLYPSNLTSDAETGLGRYTDDQVRDAIIKGIRPADGSRMLPFPMPWVSYSGLSEEDVLAIVAYLRTLPPIYNRIPEREEPNIFSYLGMKFQMLILKKSFPAFIYPGNAGQSKDASMSYEASREVTP